MKLFAAAALCAFLLAAPAPCEGPKSLRLTVGQKSREAQVLERGPKKALLFYAENSYQCLWLDSAAVLAAKEAAKKYNEQFQQKRLKKSKKGGARLVYGGAEVFLEWGSKKEALDRGSPAKARFGYVFWQGSPYFCVSLSSVQDKAGAKSHVLENSEETSLLFTRSQIQAALDALSL